MNVRWILSVDGHQRWGGLTASVGSKWCFDISKIDNVVGPKSVLAVRWGKKLVDPITLWINCLYKLYISAVINLKPVFK